MIKKPEIIYRITRTNSKYGKTKSFFKGDDFYFHGRLARNREFYLAIFSIFIYLTSNASFAQPSNDNCSNAQLLCANMQFSANNITATAECSGGADGDCGLITWCFNVSNSVWFKFVTNDIGGAATVSVSSTGALDGSLIATSTPCDTSGYIPIDCKNNQTGSFTLASNSLAPNTVYWVMIDGSSGNQSNFQIAVFGSAVDWDVTKTTTDATCDNSCDGSAAVTPLDGTAPFNYQWSSGGCTDSTCTGLCAGNYNVTVTDSIGCSTIEPFTIDTLPPATIAMTTSDEQCPGACNGTASAALSSGQTPYSYAWNTIPAQSSQTATGLCNGTYSVTVTDAQGCDTNKSLIINTLPSATISVSLIDAQCPCTGNVTGSGAATATLSSGPAPITYQWNTIPAQNAQTATALCPGTYSVTVTDSAGCDTNTTVTINVLPPPEASVTPVVKCGNSCDATATASFTSNQTPFTYQWTTSPVQSSQTATGLCPGTDSVIVTDNAGCGDTVPFTIDPPPDITSVTVTTSDVKCGNMGSATAAVEGGTNPYTFSWNTGSAASAIGSLSPGTYSVTVTDSNNCEETSQGTVAESECDLRMTPATKFSPNGDGINDTWKISNAERYPDNKVTVYNRWGQLVYSANGYDNADVVWEGKLVPDGIYFFIMYEDRNNKKDEEGVKYGSVTLLR